MLAHLFAGRLRIAATQHREQMSMCCDSGSCRFRTTAVTVVDRLHLAETGKGGLKQPVSRRIGDRAVEGKREPVEIVRLIND